MTLTKEETEKAVKVITTALKGYELAEKRNTIYKLMNETAPIVSEQEAEKLSSEIKKLELDIKEGKEALAALLGHLGYLQIERKMSEAQRGVPFDEKLGDSKNG
jgi:hypothetical protein